MNHLDHDLLLTLAGGLAWAFFDIGPKAVRRPPRLSDPWSGWCRWWVDILLSFTLAAACCGVIYWAHEAPILGLCG